MLAEPYVDTNIAPAIQTTTRPTKDKMIDYTNLYIKNLDPQVTSYDLFQRFKDFGKIISARVMKDTQTSISKGFGFVSFTTMDEANMAMQRMQGVKIHYKAISITFHEPKKSAQRKGNMEYVPQQPFQQQPYPYIYSANQSPPPPVYGNAYPHPRFVPEHNMSFKQPIHDVNGYMPPPPPLSQVKNTANAVAPPPPYAYSPMHHATHTATTNNAFESNHFIVSPSPPPSMNAPVPPPGYSHHLQRTTSNDSNPANSFQRQKLREAISLHLKPSQNRMNDLEDLVDMIQSLKKRDLSLCLFNPTFLKQKISEAHRALYVFDDDDDERRKSVSVATTPSLVHRHLDDEKSGDEDDEYSIATLLASLEGKPLNKKKKILGDVLFPHVKATGVRRAPKVTIWLLDNVPLDELAAVMYDHNELSRMAHHASSQIQ